MMNIKQLAEHVVRPVLLDLNMWSDSAEVLVIGTGIAESNNRELHQIGGPAIGFWQMEPTTHDDIWETYLKYRQETARDVAQWACKNQPLNANQMHGNLYYAVAMCRLKYKRDKARLPSCHDHEEMANYHKRVYNSQLGAANPKRTKHDFAHVFETLYGENDELFNKKS